MKKNYLILLLSVVLALSALLFPACKPQEQSESAKPPTVSAADASGSSRSMTPRSFTLFIAP